MDYYERQPVYRDQPIIMVLILLISLIGWYFFAMQIVLGIQMGNRPAPDWVVWLIWLAFGIVFPLFFIFTKLETKINRQNLEFRYFPIHLSWRKIPFSEIEKAESTEYRPIREFGGWGIRFGRQGKAYTVSGNSGVLICLKNGKSFILGSKNAEELKDVLKTIDHLHRQ